MQTPFNFFYDYTDSIIIISNSQKGSLETLLTYIYILTSKEN